MRLTGVIGAAALVALLLVVGCGGGGGDETKAASSGSAKSAGSKPEAGGGGNGSGAAEGSGGRAEKGAAGGGNGGDGSESPNAGTAGAQSGSPAGKQAESNSGGGSGETGGGAPSKAEFVAAANAICAKSSQKIEKELSAQLGRAGLKNVTKQAPAIVNGAVVPALEAEMRVLGSLETPPSGDQGLGTVIEALGEVIGEAQADPLEFVAGPDPFAKSKQASDATGFKRCGI